MGLRWSSKSCIYNYSDKDFHFDFCIRKNSNKTKNSLSKLQGFHLPSGDGVSKSILPSHTKQKEPKKHWKRSYRVSIMMVKPWNRLNRNKENHENITQNRLNPNKYVFHILIQDIKEKLLIPYNITHKCKILKTNPWIEASWKILPQIKKDEGWRRNTHDSNNEIYIFYHWEFKQCEFGELQHWGKNRWIEST